MPENSRSKLILASASPRRRELLLQVGIVPDQVIPANIDETVLRREKPVEYVQRMSVSKAAHVSATVEGTFVLGADTIVACGRRIYGKPDNPSEAESHLRALSGRSHKVYGAISLVDPDGQQVGRCVETVVRFKRLSGQELRTYLATEEWRDKAGGYAIQGRASAFIERISGSYTNVVGLPLFETVQLLRGRGFRGD